MVVALEGDALRWYLWENKRHPIRRWSDLKDFILRQFRSSTGGSLYEQWLATVQTTTVAEYRRMFIETAAPLERISEEILMGQFLNGLKEDVKAEVRMLNPLSLEQAMELALRVEEKNKATRWRKPSFGFVRTRSYAFSTRSSIPTAGQTFGNQTSPNSVRSWVTGIGDSVSSVNMANSSGLSNKSTTEVKRLTEKELQEKRSKGLCFRCDDKWSIGHRCKKRELSVLLMDDEDGADDQSSEPPSPTEEIPPEVKVHSEVSLNSVIGLTNPKTMKLRGFIGNGEVVVMIDPGATHNFVSLEKVKELGIPVTDSGQFVVSLGNGEAIRGSGVCKKVVLQLDGGVVVEEEFLSLQLGTSDVILGIQWLEKLGNVTTNWKSHVM